MAPTNTCIICPITRPDSEPRPPHQPPVCDGDRALIYRWLGDIANLIADLSNPEPPIINQRQYERFGVEYLKNNQRRVVSLGQVWSDPVSALGGVSPINSRSKQPSVSGSRERPIPINVAVLDLQAPANARDSGTAWPEDQVGYLSAATVLDEWIREFRTRLWPDHHLPPATVDEMVAWLRASVGNERTRIDDICDQHPQVADFAFGVKALRVALRSVMGETDPRPELIEGVACRACDLRSLIRRPGDEYASECASCGQLLTETEYAEWTKELVRRESVNSVADCTSAE